MAASAVSANGSCIAILTVWIQSKGRSRKWLYHIVIFRMELFFSGRSRSGVGAGVGVDIFRLESESELESLEIC